MTVIPAGYSLVTIKHQVPAQGGLREAIISFGLDGDPSPATAQTIYLTYVQWVWNEIGSAEAYLTGVTMRNETVVAEFSDSAQGTVTQTPDSPQASLLVRKSTGLAGRKFRGRMYPPAQVYVNTYDTGGTMTGGTQTEYQAAYSSFLGELEANAGLMMLLHNDSTPPTQVQALIVDPNVATQRRRTGR